MDQAKIVFDIGALEEGEELNQAEARRFLRDLNDLLTHGDYALRIGTAEMQS